MNPIETIRSRVLDAVVERVFYEMSDEEMQTLWSQYYADPSQLGDAFVGMKPLAEQAPVYGWFVDRELARRGMVIEGEFTSVPDGNGLQLPEG